MNVSDEMLMAYADREYDLPEFAAERAAIEAAVKADSELARRVEQHRALRRQLGALYAEMLTEPVPARLEAAVRSAGTTSRPSSVTYLERLRSERRAQSVANSIAKHALRRYGAWSAVAASLVAGLITGYFVQVSRTLGPISMSGGHLIARASLDQALTRELSGAPARADGVRLGLSFKSKAGAYCRTFTLPEKEPIGGLACRQGAEWRIQALAPGETATGPQGVYRPAGSEMPAAVRAAVEQQIAGDPFDAQGESQARQNQWK
jgi:hypothetical protein